jgi:hypothetical protein
MKKLVKFLLLIICLCSLTSCYYWTYLDFNEFIKKQGNGYEGTVIVHEENTFFSDATYTIFYDQYHHESGIYVEGRKNELYYYTQLVFNDSLDARSFLRFEIGYTSDSKVYDILGILEHSNYKKGYAKIDEAFYNLYDKTKQSLMSEYNSFCLTTIVETLDVLETKVNPLFNKTMKDWGFNY